jgi:hypothetical protein
VLLLCPAGYFMSCYFMLSVYIFSLNSTTVTVVRFGRKQKKCVYLICHYWLEGSSHFSWIRSSVERCSVKMSKALSL